MTCSNITMLFLIFVILPKLRAALLELQSADVISKGALIIISCTRQWARQIKGQGLIAIMTEYCL